MSKMQGVKFFMSHVFIKIQSLRDCLFLAILLWISAGTCFAGSIVAELDRNEISLGEAAVLTITISGDLKGEVPVPEIPGVDLQNGGTSTNMQIINGSISRESSYSYVLTPQKAGQFTIPSITATIDKETMKSVPLTLKVMGQGQGRGKGGALQQAPSGSGQPGVDDDDSLGQAAGGQEPAVFLERENRPSSLYNGQAIVSTLKLYARVRILQLMPEKEPAPEWRVIDTDKSSTHNESRGGVMYSVTQYNQILIPLKSGPIKIPRASLRVTYLEPRAARPMNPRSIWDMFRGSGIFDGGQQKTVKVTTKEGSIKVLELPKDTHQGVTYDAVGEFEVIGDVSSHSLQVNDTATVSVTVSGQGALDRMAPFKLNLGTSVKIYEDKPSLKEQVTAEGLNSSKTFKIAIVPTQPGVLSLGSLDFGYFNPQKAQWEHKSVQLGELQVGGSAAATSSTAAASQTMQPKADAAPQEKTREETKLQAAPVPSLNDTLRSETNLEEKSWSLLTKVSILVGILGLVALLTTLWLWKKQRGHIPSDWPEKEKLMAAARGNYAPCSLEDLLQHLGERVFNRPGLTAKELSTFLRSDLKTSEALEMWIQDLQNLELKKYKDQNPTRQDVEQLWLQFKKALKDAK
jgi:hypothetical protein